MKSEEQAILLTNEDHANSGHRVERAHKITHKSTKSGTLVKGQILLGMIILTSGYTLLVRYSRSTTHPAHLYFSSTTVFLMECLKITITGVMLLRQCRFSPSELNALLAKEFFGKPIELVKMSAPSLAYALQNNLDFIALSNLDAGVYQVTSQLKVVTTAIFMMIFLGRHFSLRRWMAIIFLFSGVAAIQMNQLDGKAPVTTANNPLVGLVAVLCCCATAGFAGVYFEMMLKDGSSTPFWVRNLQMYSCGIVSTGLAILMSESGSIREKGFFYGYTRYVYLIVVFSALNGIYISLVMKLLDNLHKSFASSISIILVVVVSLLIFPDAHIGYLFTFGTVTVIASILLYNSVHE